MLHLALKALILFSAIFLCPALPCGAAAQSISDRIVSEHVRMILPMEREWLGRDVIMDLERCWRFVNGLMGGALPRRILVEVNWNESRSKTDPEGRILVGMRTPAADFDMRNYLIRSAARETARLGLLGLSRGTPARGGNEFLLEGMSEIVAREFFRTTRRLAGAWIHAQMQDRIKPLALAQLSSPSAQGGSQDLRTEASAITFLLTCTDLHGRDRTLKLFESLRRGVSLEQSVAEIFRTTSPALEEAWLKRVRSYTIAEGLQASQDEDRPQLERVQCVPVSNAGGVRLQLRLYIRKGANILLPEGVYAYAEPPSPVFVGRPPAERGAQYLLIEVPSAPGNLPPAFDYRIIAVDEGGAVSDWQGACTPAS